LGSLFRADGSKQPDLAGWKWRHDDVSLHKGSDLSAALGRIKAKTYAVPFSGDMFFPPDDCEAE
jgi:homoserine O-acetyltransferase